jgi:hypothetical protein
MWSAIVTFGGWMLFYLVLLFYVRWIVLERAFFAGEDPEHWGSRSGSAQSPAGPQRPMQTRRSPSTWSLGMPA